MPERFEIADSRGVRWEVTLVGPIGAGSFPGLVDDVPKTFQATFRRPGLTGVIQVTVPDPALDKNQARQLLEEQLEWRHEAWARQE